MGEATAKLPSIKVLLTSGYSDVAPGEGGGVQAPLLRKPYKLRDLARAVRRSLDSDAAARAMPEPRGGEAARPRA